MKKIPSLKELFIFLAPFIILAEIMMIISGIICDMPWWAYCAPVGIATGCYIIAFPFWRRKKLK